MVRVPGRSKYFYLWPIFYSEKDARDVAFAGAVVIALGAVVDVWMYYLKEGVIAVISAFLIRYILVHLTFRLNRMISSLAFLDFAAIKTYGAIVEPQSVVSAVWSAVLPILPGLLLFHAVRAAYWYHGQKITPKAETATP